MVGQSYAESFWGGELNSTHGCEALVKRKNEGKKMCQELEEYLKKRAKLEYDFSKSLSNLAKCFKFREQTGKLETSFNQFRQELDNIASSHYGAGTFFSNQADAMKSFREEQSAKAKQAEENMTKAQNSKLDNLSRIAQLEKTYEKKSRDRDVSETSLREMEREGRELDKAKTRLTKAREDAEKADNNYKTGVIVLEDATQTWEKAMESTCQIVQELDEKRVRYLRQELWLCVNVDSKVSLDIDNCCESVRQKLERCDVTEDIRSFLKIASTGTKKPKHYTFRPYTSYTRDANSDGGSTSSNEEDRNTLPKSSSNGQSKDTLKGRNVFSKLKNQLKQ